MAKINRSLGWVWVCVCVYGQGLQTYIVSSSLFADSVSLHTMILKLELFNPDQIIIALSVLKLK